MMKTAIKLPHHAWVLVGDGRKAVLLRNEGDALYPDLVVRRTLDAGPNPPTHEQGADVPGRAIHGGQRSAMEQTDWHAAAEADFAREMADAVAEVCRTETVESLIVVAPPRALADLRKALPDSVRAAVTAEINKDLTHLRADEIAQHLTAA